ncbi:uncharacterized protein LOC127796347 [Diospyros lotus]|uniref:uncharacterized protein LOC127796347 n=1 Tax=Diospyros lotus TaxID=55363 RepID=UPI00225B492C|nr:uncharacterized protein LOC127796347 [Diospyros lotus]
MQKIKYMTDKKRILCFATFCVIISVTIRIITLKLLRSERSNQQRKKKKEMQNLKTIHFLHLVLLILNFFPPTVAHESPRFCGKIKIKAPFLNQKATNQSSLLSKMVLCKSQRLYFRTSIGLFHISSIDYTSKLLTISHSSCSSSSNFVSPSLLSVGFPYPPLPNSLALFDCSLNDHPYQVGDMCASLHGCKQKLGKASSCLLVNDLANLDKGFHPRDLNCSSYSGVYSNSPVVDNLKGYEFGTRISFDVPDHVPNICEECEKPNGHCGVGLRCICHPKECKDKVISNGVIIYPFGGTLFSMLSCIFATVILTGS